MPLDSSTSSRSDWPPVTPQLRVRIPDHVAHRVFPGQTVLLNFKAGEYHGLGGAGISMFEALGEGLTVAEVASLIARRYGLALANAERDVLELCAKLLARGLIEPA